MSERFFHWIDRAKFALSPWAAGFGGVVFVRFLLEAFSSAERRAALPTDAPTLVHYGLFYLVVVLSLALVLHAFAPSGIRALKAVLLGLPLIWLAPLIDLAISGGEGIPMAYVFRGAGALLSSFVQFLNPLSPHDITPGIRIEVAVMLVAISLYVYAATRKWWRGVLAAALSYATIFFWLALPSLIKLAYDALSPFPADPSVTAFWLKNSAAALTARGFLHPSVEAWGWSAAQLLFNVAISRWLYLFAALLLLRWAAISWRTKLGALLKNSRPERVTYYFLIAMTGFAAAAYTDAWNPADTNGMDLVAIAVLPIALYCAWMFSVGVNDLEDVRIDRVSNPQRPLVTGALTAEDVRETNRVFLALAVTGGFLGGSYALFFVAAFIAAYYVYSAAPFRLRRFPVVSSFLIATASLAAALLGFYAVSADRTADAFPLPFGAMLFLAVAMGSVMKDVKDVEGDRRDGVRTIPNLFGPAWGTRVAGVLLGAAFLSPAFLLPSFPLSVVSAVTAVAAYLLVNTRPYREIRVFALIFAYILVATIVLL